MILKYIQMKFLDQRMENLIMSFLAIPSLTNESRKNILNNLQKEGTSVLQIPSLEELSLGNARIDNLRPIAVNDLLGREPIKINAINLRRKFEGKSIFITGAGGSIGSELCRQILSLKPSSIILFDISEHNLYKIHQELNLLATKDTELVPVLGDATKYKLLEDIFSKRLIDYVFHAAAYKHVPMVEINPIQGIFNNVVSTRNICKCSLRFSVSKMILISTDKAVRPTNIMGASKRLSELIVQAYQQESEKLSTLNDANSKRSMFSMVRFGNVLGSSGSVVPLFEKQIQKVVL